MSLGRQAKTLSKAQIEAVVCYLNSTRYPLRNRAILFLSVKAWLRAKEIANLTWPMVTDSSGYVGDFIRLENRASKGKFGGRVVPINAALKEVLEELHRKKWLADRGYVIRTERSNRTRPQAIVNLFSKWYAVVGLQGCSSHSGRRTFITNARRISTVGGSLRDVQLLAGHTNLRTTQGYIEGDGEAQRRIVQLL